MFNDFEFEYQGKTVICTAWTDPNPEKDPFTIAKFIKTNSFLCSNIIFVLRYKKESVPKGTIYEIVINSTGPLNIYFLAMKIEKVIQHEFNIEQNTDNVTFDFIFE